LNKIFLTYIKTNNSRWGPHPVHATTGSVWSVGGRPLFWNCSFNRFTGSSTLFSHDSSNHADDWDNE